MILLNWNGSYFYRRSVNVLCSGCLLNEEEKKEGHMLCLLTLQNFNMHSSWLVICKTWTRVVIWGIRIRDARGACPVPPSPVGVY